MEKPKRKRGRPKKKREPELPIGNSSAVVPAGGNQSLYNMMRPESMPSSGHWNNYECNSNQQSSSSTATSQSQYFMPDMSHDQYYPHGSQMNSGNNPQNQYYMHNNMFSGPVTSSAGSNPGTSTESGQYYVNEMYPSMAGNSYYGQNSTQSQLNSPADFRMNYMTNSSCPNNSQGHSDSYVNSHTQPGVDNYSSGSNQSKPESYSMENMQSESVNYNSNNGQTDYSSTVVKQEPGNFSPNQPNTADYSASVGHPSPANYNQPVHSQPIPNNYRPGDETFSNQDVSKNFPAGPVASNDGYQHQEKGFSSRPSSTNAYRHPEQNMNSGSNLESESFGMTKQFNPGPSQTDVYMHQQGNKTFASVSDNLESYGNQERTKNFSPHNGYPASETYPNIHNTESFAAKMTPPSVGNYNIGSEPPASNTFPNGNNQVCDSKFNSSNGQGISENFPTNTVPQQSFGDSSNSASGNLPAVNNSLVTENYNSPLSDQSGCKTVKTPILENDMNNYERQAMKPATNLSDQSVISVVSPLCHSPLVSNSNSPFPVNLTTSCHAQSPSTPGNELLRSNSADSEKKEFDSIESVPPVAENNENRIDSVENAKESPAASSNSEDTANYTLDLSSKKVDDVEKKEIFEKDNSESTPLSNEQSKPSASDPIDSPTEPALSVGNSSSVSSCVPQQDSISSPKSQHSVGTNPGSIYSDASPLSQNVQRPGFKNAQSPSVCQPVQSGNNYVDDQSIVNQATDNAQGQHPLYPPNNQSPANNSSSQPPLFQNDQSTPNNQLVPSNHFSNSPAPSASPDQSSVYPQYSTSYPSTSRFSAFSPSASLSSTSLSALSSYVSAWTANPNFAASQPSVQQPRAFAAASMSSNLGTSLHAAAAAHSGMSIQALEASLSSQSSVQSLGSSSSMHALGTSMSSNASVQSLGGSGGGFQSLHATAALATNLGVSASAAASMQTFGMMPGQPGFSASMSAGRSWASPGSFGSSLQRAQGQMTAPHMMSPWNMYNSYSHGYNQSYRGGYSLPEQGELTYSQHFHMKQEPRGYYGDGEY